MGAPGIWGEEFRVNAVTTGAQFSPVISALANGRFAIAYTDLSRAGLDGFTDYSDTAIRVQVFGSDGAAYSETVQVNTATSYRQEAPRMAPLANGGFVIAYSDHSTGWNTGGDDPSAEAVRLQRFDADGGTLGTETLVNTNVLGPQHYPCVALLENGQFIVSWDDGYADADADLKAQLFNSDGSFAGTEFRLNAGTEGWQSGSDIAALTGGGYAVTWVDAEGIDGDAATIMARVFSGDGTALATEFQVNTAATGDQFQPSITALAGGGFFIAWTDNSRGLDTWGDDTSNYAIRGQMFDAAGTAVGSEFLVNQVTTYGQSQPEVLALADGRFIVAFSDTSGGLETGGDDAEYGAIRARIFNPDGSPDGTEFLVNVTTTGHQNEPQMAELADGRVVFTWTDYSYGAETGGDDPSNGAIRARILDLRQTAVDLIGSAAGDDFLGTPWADKIAGAGGNDTLTGGEGNDWLIGGTGDDVLDGSDGDDQLIGETGNDRLIGGSGSDQLIGKTGNDVLDGGDGNDLGKGNAGNDTLRGGAGADTLLGGNNHDLLFGGAASDLLKGDRGEDTLYGNEGRDTLFGGGGDDVLHGGADKDELLGGGRRDQLTGGGGKDLLTGGRGADVFVFTGAWDSRPGARNRDVITDFREGKDLIDLSALVDDGHTADNARLRFLDHGDFTGVAGQFRYSHNDKRSLIRIDLDGDAKSDMEIQLTGWHQLDVNDFIL